MKNNVEEEEDDDDDNNNNDNKGKRTSVRDSQVNSQFVYTYILNHKGDITP